MSSGRRREGAAVTPSGPPTVGGSDDPSAGHGVDSLMRTSTLCPSAKRLASGMVWTKLHGPAMRSHGSRPRPAPPRSRRSANDQRPPMTSAGVCAGQTANTNDNQQQPRTQEQNPAYRPAHPSPRTPWGGGRPGVTGAHHQTGLTARAGRRRGGVNRHAPLPRQRRGRPGVTPSVVRSPAVSAPGASHRPARPRPAWWPAVPGRRAGPGSDGTAARPGTSSRWLRRR